MTAQEFNATRRARTISVSRDGYRLHAQVIPPDDSAASGSANTPANTPAPWIVFGNSLVTDLSIWDAQVARLAGAYGILRYDQAGHGQSGQPEGPVTFDDLGADLLAVMDAAGVDRAIYVGLSMGVPTGLAAHQMAAGRFAALIFSDGQARTAPGGAAGWAERIASARTSGMEAFAAATADRWLTASTKSAPDTDPNTGPVTDPNTGPNTDPNVDRPARLRAMIAATPFEGFALCATALMAYDYTDALARITCPTLLIAGAEDGAMPDGMATRLKPAIAGARMQVIDKAGHVPCFEQPEVFTAVLQEFLETACQDVPA